VRKTQRAVASELRRANINPGEMVLIEPSLEDIFIASMR
jgi:hypothetical protein